MSDDVGRCEWVESFCAFLTRPRTTGKLWPSYNITATGPDSPLLGVARAVSSPVKHTQAVLWLS